VKSALLPLPLWLLFEVRNRIGRAREELGPGWAWFLLEKALRSAGFEPGSNAEIVAAGKRFPLRPAGVDEGVCPFCRESIQEGDAIASVACRHSFHGECGREWFRRSARCPYCGAFV
jgi:hypothetical protein